MVSTCNRLDLQTLGSQPVMPKNLPEHCSSLFSPFVIWGSGPYARPFPSAPFESKYKYIK